VDFELAQLIHQARSSLREREFVEKTGLSMSEAFAELGELIRRGVRLAPWS
jgi:hypothetical protein